MRRGVRDVQRKGGDGYSGGRDQRRSECLEQKDTGVSGLFTEHFWT